MYYAGNQFFAYKGFCMRQPNCTLNVTFWKVLIPESSKELTYIVLNFSVISVIFDRDYKT